ncbi:hypothetical protein ERJ75_001577200 [Trypanosoma vivax]|nr:hypothetical protein ERJ75_001577200 [Trypanosoma vivax]
MPSAYQVPTGASIGQHTQCLVSNSPALELVNEPGADVRSWGSLACKAAWQAIPRQWEMPWRCQVVCCSFLEGCPVVVAASPSYSVAFRPSRGVQGRRERTCNATRAVLRSKARSCLARCADIVLRAILHFCWLALGVHTSARSRYFEERGEGRSCLSSSKEARHCGDAPRRRQCGLLHPTRDSLKHSSKCLF